MSRKVMRCSFCGRPDSEVAKLVAGPPRLFAGPVYICDRCADQTLRIMDGHKVDARPHAEPVSVFRRVLRRFGGSSAQRH
jgi:ATP-dependent protease Clp ATPase subunit